MNFTKKELLYIVIFQIHWKLKGAQNCPVKLFTTLLILKRQQYSEKKGQ